MPDTHGPRRPAVAVAALAVSLALASCDIFGPQGERVMGTIFFSPATTAEDVFIVPDTVTVGQDFVVSIYTDVGGCISGTSRTTVLNYGRFAEVIPVDHDSGHDVCVTEPLSPFLHEATVRFPEPGEAEVVLRARNFQTDEEVRLVEPVQVECPPGTEPWTVAVGERGEVPGGGEGTPPPRPPPCR